MMDSQNLNKPSGYVINLFQYARRYEYNYSGMLEYFNSLVDKHKNDESSDPGYLCFGDFDRIEIIPIDTFRKFHDVSLRAKDWLGKRQSVLLYNIEDEEYPTRIYYRQDSQEKQIGQWLFADLKTKPQQQNFFCLSMLSLTNEIIFKCGQETDQAGLIKEMRRKILTLIDDIQKCQDTPFLTCEVYGTFNSSEIAIVWLADQYTDVLQIIDYLKHIYCQTGKDKTPAFLNSFSVIAQSDKAQKKICNGVQIDKKARALVQIAIHDAVKSYNEVQNLAESLIPEGCKEESKIYYSVGEYDIVVDLPAQEVFSLLTPQGKLSIGRRDHQKYVIEDRKILHNNTRLVYVLDNDDKLQERLRQLVIEERFKLNISFPDDNKDQSESDALLGELEKELKEDPPEKSCRDEDKSNLTLYQAVRERLKIITPSSGMIDILDLLYTDYRSAIGTAYSALWVSDLHRQFKAVLNVILELLSEDSKTDDSKTDALAWSWKDYLELHNAFKQQIYHLMQSNSMFFETPSCHLRATGQFDYLMHTYYGITKKILNLIYLLQRDGKQSELVPFITVNIVPQVKTELFFESVVDKMRVWNVDIPQAIIFNPYRGVNYLCHELFHHAAPVDRAKRNRDMGKLFLSVIMRDQFRKVFEHMIGLSEPASNDKAGTDLNKFELTSNDKIEITRILYFEGNANAQNNPVLFEAICAFVEENYEAVIESKLCFPSSSDADLLCSAYQKRLFEFANSSASDDFFFQLFGQLLENIWERYERYCSSVCPECDFEKDDPIFKENLEKIYAYIQYYRKDKSSREEFIRNHQSFRHTAIRNAASEKSPDVVWEGLREACCDVAMITMTGMSKVDYLLFCIQAWTDVYRDRGELYKKTFRNKDVLRSSIVLAYGCICGLSDWERIPYTNVNGKCSFEILTDAENQEFLSRYIAFYYHPDQNNKDSREKYFNDLRGEAENWLKLYADHYLDFSLNEIVLFSSMKRILDDYNIELRIQKINEPENKRRAEEIQEEFVQTMRKYKDFLSSVSIPSIFTEDTDMIIRSHRKKSFHYDLDLASHFQKQVSLRKLAEVNKEVREKLDNSAKRQEKGSMDASNPAGGSALKNFLCLQQENVPTDNEWKFHVYDLGQLQFYLRHCAELLNAGSATNIGSSMPSNLSVIWYRGQKCEEYSLLPTIVREYHKDKYRKAFPTLRSFQEHLYNEFKFRADGALEATSDGEYTISDYIALMQHYQETSNFLDWTENAFKALYFALQKTIQALRKNQKNSAQYNATVTLFNPMTYNRQRNQVISRLSPDPLWGLKPFFKKIHENEKGRYYKMPNLSVAKDAEYYDAFLLGDRDFDCFAATSAWTNYLECVNSASGDRELFLPLAIWTSRWNPRIRAQSGCFVAFNLYTPPDLSSLLKPSNDPYPNIFKHMSLDKIQDRLKHDFPGEMFMYQIVIDKTCCDDIAEWLIEGMGMSDSDVYPDLSKLKERFEDNQSKCDIG